MYKSFVSIVCIAVLFVSCKTVSVQQNVQKATTQSIILGSVGIHDGSVFNERYSNTAFPEYKQPIKISVAAIPFSKKTYNAFTEAKTFQSGNVTIAYIDSLVKKPKFINIHISDKVALIKALNVKANADVKNYLSNENGTNIVTNISMAMQQQDLSDVAQADEVFLVQSGLKSYALQLFKNGKQSQTINFNQGIVFAYKASSCCWQENDKYELNIVDLAEGNNSCPKETYKSAKRAKKRINYFKF